MWPTSRSLPRSELDLYFLSAFVFAALALSLTCVVISLLVCENQAYFVAAGMVW